jgi:hypothetical protein
MTTVRTLLRDLVERRLWPVALLLVAAAVAVPVYLGRPASSEETDAPAAVAQSDGVKASKVAVTLEDSASDGESHGKVRNPFKQQHVSKTSKADAGGSGSTPNGATTSGGSSPSSPSVPDTPSGAGIGSGTSGSGDTGSGSGGSTGGTTDDDATKRSDVDITRVSLHLGKIGELKTYKDVARLSPLPSAGNPLFVFTGVLKDGKTVVLLPSSTVQLSEESDVSCKPSNKSCQKLELTQDDTVFFTIAGDTTGTQYQLDIISVRLKSGGSVKATAAALKRHSNFGAATLRDAHVYRSGEFQGASDYRWLPKTGLLARVPEHGTGATAASAGDAAASLPGRPVWHFEG